MNRQTRKRVRAAIKRGDPATAMSIIIEAHDIRSPVVVGCGKEGIADAIESARSNGASYVTIHYEPVFKVDMWSPDRAELETLERATNEFMDELRDMGLIDGNVATTEWFTGSGFKDPN